MKLNVCIVGLGYVGLPLAVEFGKTRNVVGYDISNNRIAELRHGNDKTLEVDSEELKKAKYLTFTNQLDDIKSADLYIVTVPTPIDHHNQPDLSPLINSSKSIGSILKRGDIVVYESTVYPGATEEVCVPILEKESGLLYNQDFFCGYSPERINPGDKEHRVTTIKKVTSGSNDEIAQIVDDLYSEIIQAGTHKAPSIKVAEAAKVIENTQRDLNIALINELSVIFNKMNIDTLDVLEAAGTKWNFLPFRPGLVGGHCIGVDPYYLTYKAESIGYRPEIILAGRKMNDQMSTYVASQLIKRMTNLSVKVFNSRVLIMGLSFKENCPDLRNTKVIDLVNELNSYGCIVDVFDPWVDADEALKEYNLELTRSLKENTYNAIILAVAHDEFKELGKTIKSYIVDGGIIYDLKYILPIKESSMRL